MLHCFFCFYSCPVASILDTARGKFVNVNVIASNPTKTCHCMWNKGHPPYRGHPDLTWSGPCVLLWAHPPLLAPCPLAPATWASSIPQRCPFQKLCTYYFCYLQQYSQVLCMAGSILNFRSQLTYHLLGQIVSKVATILANPILFLYYLVFVVPHPYHSL